MKYNKPTNDRITIFKRSNAKGEYTIKLSFEQDFLDDLCIGDGGTVETRAFIEKWLQAVAQENAALPAHTMGKHTLHQWVFDKSIAITDEEVKARLEKIRLKKEQQQKQTKKTVKKPVAKKKQQPKKKPKNKE